jgi:Uma2 family endonuclease
MTDDELLRFCERQEVVHVEREPNGELELRPIGGTEAGAVSAEVIADMYQWNRLEGKGRLLPNVGYFLRDESMRAARVSWLSNGRFNAVPAEFRRGFVRACPEFVVEIVSFNYTLTEVRTRMEMWLANGAELGWLIDAERKAVEIYRPGREPEVLEGGSRVEGEGPVAGFVLELGRIWG